MSKFDVTLLTDHRYLETSYPDQYSQNVVDEDQSVLDELKKLGLNVHRTNWDNPDFDWSSTAHILFRTTWDYSERFEEFSKWLMDVSQKTTLINPKELIFWNVDKHYLQELQNNGVRIPNTVFVETGDTRTLKEIANSTNWKEFILKPAVSAGSRHTYRFGPSDIEKHEGIFSELIANESMMLQEFQAQVVSKGEVAFMVFGGKFSHAVLKKAKPGDFRVQDDFGGSIHTYEATPEEIAFVEKAFNACDPTPIYARVDVIWNNENEMVVIEIELVEPELWFRMNDKSAEKFASAIHSYIK